MASEKNKESIQVINLDSFQKERGEKKDFFREVAFKNNEKRINWYHVVTHLLAILIISTYLVLICFNAKIPSEYSTLVSVVIGFYFAKNFLNNTN